MTHRVLYLLRHGNHDEDPGDPDDDGPLNSLGARQAKLTVPRLRSIPFTAIRHSTMRRAADTAAIIGAELPDVPLLPTDLLRESVPVVPSDEVLTEGQREFFAAHPQEQLDREVARMRMAIAEFTAIGEPVVELLVCHGNVLRWFVNWALGAPEHAWLNMSAYNCGLSAIYLSLTAPPRLVMHNDASHLPEDLRATDYPAWARW